MTVYERAAKLASELPLVKVVAAARQIAKIPDGGMSAVKMAAAWGTSASKPVVKDFNAAVVQAGLSGKEIAAALYAAGETMRKIKAETQIDLIWTGPQTTAIPVRRNEQALCELIDSAQRELFIVSFVAYKAEKVYAAMKKAIDRGVKVSFLVEASKEHGGTLEIDPVKTLKEKFPTATYYRWESADSTKKRCVHAKCAVADGDVALVTSANLTGAAMDDNMELGILIRSREIAGKLAAHLKALAVENIIKEIH